MSLVIRFVISLFALLLMFEGLVSAFHLLNLPSDRAVVGGVCLLLITAAGGFAVFGLIWTRRWAGKWKRLR